MKFYHISKDIENIIKEFTPRVPGDRMVGEDGVTKRICVTPTLSNCLTAVPWKSEIGYLCDKELPVRIYEIEVTDEDILSSDYLYKSGFVDDANITKEHWILNSIKPSKIYDIIIEEYCEDLYTIIPYNKIENDDYECSDDSEFTLFKYTIVNEIVEDV